MLDDHCYRTRMKTLLIYHHMRTRRKASQLGAGAVSLISRQSLLECMQNLYDSHIGTLLLEYPFVAPLPNHAAPIRSWMSLAVES